MVECILCRTVCIIYVYGNARNNEKTMKIILVAEHASIDFGGEAALPCHYFRVLRARNYDVNLVVHERSRSFLSRVFKNDGDHIYYVKDSRMHRFLHACQRYLPRRLGGMTFGFLLRVLTQYIQKRLVQRLIVEDNKNNNIVVHQVIPVSPKEPSLLFGLNVPVVIGPLNGGMYYPKGFEGYEGRLSLWFNDIGRVISKPINCLFRGKRNAAVIMVSNQRTADALPSGLKGDVRFIVENGVDLSVWQAAASDKTSELPTFVYVGRLVDWKAVDILLDAFFKACDVYGPMQLRIIGDGDQREYLEQIVLKHHDQAGEVLFHGWIAQQDIAPILSNSVALVLPSLYECGGAVVLEAMALSKAVISTNWGGPSDYLDDSCGILIEPTSREGLVDGFSDAMLRLANNSALSKSLGVCGRKKIEEHYNWEKKVDDVIDIYGQQFSDD